MKHNCQDYIIRYIRKDLHGLKIKSPVVLHYHFYEPNRKRDLDNIASFCMKVTQDSLVISKTIENDGWENVIGFVCEFSVDKMNPRIEVTLEERGNDNESE